jgi:hypothetical protein
MPFELPFRIYDGSRSIDSGSAAATDGDANDDCYHTAIHTAATEIAEGIYTAAEMVASSIDCV